MSNKQPPPNIVLLNKGKTNPLSIIHEFIDLEDTQQQIPLELLDSIFITLENGEKYKINQSAIHKNLKLSELDKTLSRIGVPDDITTIEIMIDTAEAETFIESEVSQILDNIFND